MLKGTVYGHIGAGVCVRARACVRACVRARVYVCVCVCERVHVCEAQLHPYTTYLKEGPGIAPQKGLCLRLVPTEGHIHVKTASLCGERTSSLQPLQDHSHLWVA